MLKMMIYDADVLKCYCDGYVFRCVDLSCWFLVIVHYEYVCFVMVIMFHGIS